MTVYKMDTPNITQKQFKRKLIFIFVWLYVGYESLANDPEVDIVYVGAIHPAHLEICKLMFNAGKHILCEKV